MWSMLSLCPYLTWQSSNGAWPFWTTQLLVPRWSHSRTVKFKNVWFWWESLSKMAKRLHSKCCSFNERFGISPLQNVLTDVNWPSLPKNQQKKKLHHFEAVHKEVDFYVCKHTYDALNRHFWQNISTIRV